MRWKLEGQLMPAERAVLYEEIRKNAPALVLEIGTWKGGGSTYQITSALAANGSGHLHTCEINQEFHNLAKQIYHNTDLNKYVTLHLKPSTQLIKELIDANTIPNFLFFDGPDIPRLSLSDFQLLESHLPAGAIFSMHDWEHDLASKQILIKPYLERSSRWDIYRVLHWPDSVGLVFARKLS